MGVWLKALRLISIDQPFGAIYENTYFWKNFHQFSCFSSFFSLLVRKMLKSIFQPAFGVQSTLTLVKIYNKWGLNIRHLQYRIIWMRDFWGIFGMVFRFFPIPDWSLLYSDHSLNSEHSTVRHCLPFEYKTIPLFGSQLLK